MARRRRGAGRKVAGRRGAWFLVALVAVAVALIAGRVLHLPGGPTGGRAGTEVFFVRYTDAGHVGALVMVPRPPASGDIDARVDAALRALLRGPSAAERARGIASEIPPATTLRGVRIRDGVAEVDLSPSFGAGGGTTSMTARLWQVVYTATQFSQVRAVQIVLGGHRVPALGGEGLMIDRPIARPSSPPAF